MKNKIKELLEKIIIKGYEVNEHTRYDVCIDFSGATNSIWVRYYEEGYRQNSNSIKTLGYAYLDLADRIEKLQEILMKLEGLEKK